MKKEMKKIICKIFGHVSGGKISRGSWAMDTYYEYEVCKRCGKRKMNW